MSIPQPPFTPERYEIYVKSLTTKDFNQEIIDVEQDVTNIQNQLTTLQKNTLVNAQPIQEFQTYLTQAQEKQKILNKHKSLRELAEVYSRSNLSTVEAALVATQEAVNTIINRNRGLKVFPLDEFSLLEQEHALLEILQAEIARRKN
jgi:hypothetical protein